MESLKFLTFVVISSLIIDSTSSQGCGKFCVCTLEQTDCYFTFEDGVCLGEVSFLETYILNIYGPLCPNARNALKNSMFDNTVKVLHNDICGGIPNCRSLGTQSPPVEELTYATSKGWPPLPISPDRRPRPDRNQPVQQVTTTESTEMSDETTVSTVLTTESIEMKEETTPVENTKFTEIAATTSLLMTAITTTSEMPEITSTASTVAEEVNLEDDSDSNSDDELEPGEIPAIEDIDTDNYEYWLPELKNETKHNSRSVIGLGISVGILSIIVIVLGVCMLRKRNNQVKAKRSDEDLSRVEYNPAAESVRILEGVDPLDQLQRQVLVERLRSGIERNVEDLGFSGEDKDSLFDFEQTHRKTVAAEICWI